MDKYNFKSIEAVLEDILKQFMRFCARTICLAFVVSSVPCFFFFLIGIVVSLAKMYFGCFVFSAILCAISFEVGLFAYEMFNKLIREEM